MVVIVSLITGTNFPDHVLLGYAGVGVEAVALLSWLAGFIAVAVSAGTDICPAGNKSCVPLKGAAIFGAFEWLLFVISTTGTTRFVLNT